MRRGQRMMSTLVLIGAASILALAACSSVRVTRSQDLDARLANFSTFEILPSKSIADENLRALVGVMIAEQLAAKGLTQVEQDADLLVTFDGSAGSHEQMATGLGYAVETTEGVSW